MNPVIVRRLCLSLFVVSIFSLQAGCASKDKDWVVLLPQTDAATGAVIVTTADAQTVIDQPFQGAQIYDNDITRTSAPADKISRIFGAAIDAQPIKPQKYILYFEFETVRITEVSKAKLQAMLKEISTRQAVEIDIVGHTDSMGNIQENDKLSLDRAKEIRSQLIANGLKDQMIRVSGRGEREPIITTKDNVIERKNRRVEVTIR